MKRILILSFFALTLQYSSAQDAPFEIALESIEVPVLALIFLSLYHIAYIGKKKGYEQSETIHRFFEEATGLSY